MIIPVQQNHQFRTKRYHSQLATEEKTNYENKNILCTWLYIVLNCKTIPELFRIQNPALNLNFQLKSKGVQYYLAMDEWKSKLIF